MKKPWAGRFRERTAKTVETFTSSIPFDKRLWKYDIEGSLAHVKMLKKQNIITSKDTDSIIRALEKIKRNIQKGKFQFRDDLEDIHMNIEYALVKEIGRTGGKLHTARSRNDQVAVDLRLFLRNEIEEIQKLIKLLQTVLVKLAEKNIDIIMPGYTHLQKAQPVLLSHHVLAYFEMFERDRERLKDCLERVNVLPLGSGALAGTTLPINRKYTARLLKFSSISNNSIDAVSDRDFVIEFLSAASLFMVHLSRFSEELVLWSSAEFGFIELPDAYSTGSSIMPQKKNPDVPELIRGKAGRVFGHLMALLVILKGLPLAYNRDLQEDKVPLFDTVDTVKACTAVLTEVMPKIKFNKKVMLKAALEGYSTATDLAEYLARKGVPFRESHNITGRIVKHCFEKKKSLMDLNLKEFKKFSKIIDKDVFDYLSVESSINKKKSYGGTAKRRVMNRIKQIKTGR
ncbi:MAG: argininosuccinate lyase [Thermodesulfovibrionia bacterium]|nr:argininosuccinate lyase [Thermodesulfovibrionia bacterium]